MSEVPYYASSPYVQPRPVPENMHFVLIDLLVYHSALGCRVIKKKREGRESQWSDEWSLIGVEPVL